MVFTKKKTTRIRRKCTRWQNYGVGWQRNTQLANPSSSLITRAHCDYLDIRIFAIMFTKLQSRDRIIRRWDYKLQFSTVQRP